MRSSEIPLWQRALWRVLWFVGAVLCLGLFRLRARRHRDLPSREPYLLLPNHTSFFDPLWVVWPLWRPVRFMASEQLFRLPGLARALTAVGAFPKKKYVTDHRAIVSLMRFVRGGAVVLVFPEGNRTWDGRTQPILPGLGRLIEAAKVPVVYARVTTGHYVQPRWAHYPRFVPVRVEYDGPHTYAGADPADIEADAQRRITVDPEAPPPRGSFGWRMAHGLPEFLWACPRCLAVGGLALHPRDGNAVACERCGAAWSVDVAQRLLPRADGVEATTVPAAHARLKAHFVGADGRPTADPSARRDRGVLFEGDGALLAVGDDGAKVEVSRGRLVLREQALEAHDARGVRWSADLAEIRAVSLEVAATLQLRVGGGLYQIEARRPSTIAWHHFLVGGPTR